MYHHSASATHPVGGRAAGVLEPRSSATASDAGPAPASSPAAGSAIPTRATDDKDVITFQRCAWCGTAMYHRLLCPVCQGSDLRTERSQGVGTVRHSTVVHRNTPMARNVSLVEMAEGFVVRGRVMGPAVGIHSGDRVRLSTAKDPVRGEPVFQLLDEAYRAWS
ncbi:Zn-ribbon domain-containing OB-fold protein [Streptomyces sp. LaPpAH-108]|uniref:Zn-ribbon domain-containing OB-fold protein n=1 Tax=Streptomyces sp. LaPpAH-108 TaxID=1155714 RepID=UPI00037BAB4F|nr:zinc ribbon domain-containing protein [Streptomyces sp. LaPpAH-108]